MLTVSENHPSDPYEKLLFAVLLCAVNDAHGRDCGRNSEYEQAKALAWLKSPGAENVCDWLGLDVRRLRQKCEGLPAKEIG